MQFLNLSKFGIKKSVSNRPVIVEIGNDWIKIVENSLGQISKVKVVRLVEIDGSVSDAIARIFKELKLSKRSVIVSIPRHLVTSRILEFPSTNPGEIAEMVSLQVGKQTPYSKEEIISSHRIVDSSREGYTKVMLIIARRNIVSERVDVLRKAGITVDNVIVSSEGVYKWFCLSRFKDIKEDSGTFIVIDVDSNYSDFVVIRNGSFVYTRSILIGSNHLVGQVGQWEEKFIDEISHSLELFHNEERFVVVDRVFLCGAASLIKGLDHFLSTRLNVQVESALTNTNIKINDSIDLLHDKSYKFISMCPVIGMSIKHKELTLDLTPSGLRIQRDIEEQRKQITILGALVTSIILLISVFILIFISNKNSYLSELKQKIVEIESSSKEIDKMRMSIDLIKRRLDASNRSINVFTEIHRLTPKEIFFTSISIEENGQTILQGRSDKMSDVFEFVTTLEESPYFENVKTTYTTTKKERNQEYAKFEIICSSEKEGEF